MNIFSGMIAFILKRDNLTFSLLPAISFPAFATHKESVYKETKRAIVENLSGPGEYGFKRFLRDGYGTCFEGNGQRYYPEGKLKVFDNVDNSFLCPFLST